MTYNDFKREAHVELATFLYNEMTVEAPPGDFGMIMAGAAVRQPEASAFFVAYITIARNLLEDEDYRDRMDELIEHLGVSIAEDEADRARDDAEG